MSSTPVPINLTIKLIPKPNENATYISQMQWSENSATKSKITMSTKRQRDNLTELIDEMKKKHFNRFSQRGKIVSNQNGRIDSQDPGVFNIHYQVGSNTLAETFVREKPTETIDCEELAQRQIDDEEFGFTEDDIKNFIGFGLQHSVQTQIHTDITWKIKKIRHENRTSPSKYYARIANFIGEAHLKTAEAVLIKEFGKEGFEGIVKSAAKAAGKGGMEASLKLLSNIGGIIVKKIPIAGLICGTIFALWRISKGDYEGAKMEMISGIVSTCPGEGTALSIAIDAQLLFRDLYNPQHVQIHA